MLYILRPLNPFSIWGVVLTAIGVSTTQKMSKGTGYTIAIITFAIGPALHVRSRGGL
jgi:hypothetical protein